jgi:hypothetical protein
MGLFEAIKYPPPADYKVTTLQEYPWPLIHKWWVLIVNHIYNPFNLWPDEKKEFIRQANLVGISNVLFGNSGWKELSFDPAWKRAVIEYEDVDVS